MKKEEITYTVFKYPHFLPLWGRGGHDRMIVGFITTYAISAYRH